MKITSANAYSMNVVLSELFLPEATELYMYDGAGTMVYGPITSKQNFESGIFLAEIIKGETIVIRILCEEKYFKTVKFGIKQVVHGYRNLFPEGQKKSSGACNNNIECFPDWRTQGYGVTGILINSTHLCTGCLVNNTSNLPIPYILTANHCIDLFPPYGYPDANERALVEYWAFRFNYKSIYCNNTTVSNTVTYNYGTFRSAWPVSDFGLVQMDDFSVLNTYYLSFLGWDRTGNIPSEGVGIHHPKGDVMKISFDSDSLIETDLGESSGSGFWRVNWDDGVVEKGSSGSPLFNQNKRIIGQLTGGDSLCSSQTKFDWYGCFESSWTGGESDTTRLSNWLDPEDTEAWTTNTLTFNGIAGADPLCVSGGNYSVENLPDVTYSWTTSSNLQINGSSTGYSVDIVPNSSTPGEAWITAQMYFTELGETRSVTRNINLIMSEPYIIGDIEIKLDNAAANHAVTLFNCGNLTYTWYVVGFQDPIYTGYGQNALIYTFYDEEWSPGYINIYCKVSDGSYYDYTPYFLIHLIPHDPLSAFITGDEYVCLDDQGIWVANASGGDTEESDYTYEWYIENEYIETEDPHCPYLYYYFNSGEWSSYYNYEIDLRVYDDSTYIDANTFYFQLDYCPEKMDLIQLFPNPANEYVDVSIIKPEDLSLQNKSFKNKTIPSDDDMVIYTLYDSHGKQLYQSKTKERTHRIPLSGLINGTYHLKVIVQDRVMDKKIIISH